MLKIVWTSYGGHKSLACLVLGQKKVQMSGTSGKPSPTGEMTVGFSLTMNRAKTNGAIYGFCLAMWA